MVAANSVLRVTDSCPVALRDGRDLPRLVDERVPYVATVIDDVVEGFEDAVLYLIQFNEQDD